MDFGQADVNSIAIIFLLLVIVFYVTGLKARIIGLYKKSVTSQYLNITAKIKALDYAPDAIITIDIDGNILAWNIGAENLFLYKEKEVAGKPLTIIIPDKYKERHIRGLQKIKATNSSDLLGKPMKMEGVNKKGVEFPIELIIWRWVEENSVFYTGIIRDITQESKEELDTTLSLRMFKRGEKSGSMGFWSWDILEDVVYVSGGFKEIFGLEHTRVSSAYILKRIYHEDLPRMEATIKEAFDKKEGYTIQYRVVNTNGTLDSVEVTAGVYFNPNNELINLTGTIRLL